MSATQYTGRNAIVLGLGLTGLSLARYLAAAGATVRVADTRPAPPCAQRLRGDRPDVPLVTGPLQPSHFDGVDLIAISPGVARRTPVIAEAVARGVEIVGDIELFARALPPGQKVLAITGSNGKTTVTSLTGALCRAAGLSTVVAGNIGEAVLDVLGDFDRDMAWPEVVVLELSSFQLETTSSLSAVAATVLNVTDNHLDRYDGIDEYAAAKARIFAGSGAQVLNRDDARTMAMRIAGRSIETFGSGVPQSEAEWGLVARGGSGSDVWLARGGALLVPAADLELVGRHNALNALAAMALTSIVAKISRDVLSAAVKFQGLPHRMQRVVEIDRVLYVNDSKATTVAATKAALEGIARPVVLIAGGDGKAQNFAPLKPIVDAYCRAVLLIGRDAHAIESAIAGARAAVEQHGTLDRAVARACELARPGDAVVLSPACASLDQFSNYAERGEHFAAYVRSCREHKPVADHA